MIFAEPKNNERIGEKDMYPHIAKSMENLIYYYHQSVGDIESMRTVTCLRIKLGSNFPEHDILTAFITDGGIHRIYSIEAKFNVDVPGLFSQALKRSKYCDYCYIAVPLNANLYNYYNRFVDNKGQFVESFNIGFMIVDIISGTIGILKRAKLNCGLNKEYKDKLFRTIYKKTHQYGKYLEKNLLVESKQITLGDKK